MENKLDFEGLAAALLARSAEFASLWLPGGRMQGREYVCSDLRGGPGDSLKVNLETGLWADFAGDAKGGDLISLYAAIENIKNGDAAKRLADQLNYRLKPEPVERAVAVEHKITRPPATAAVPGMIHPKFGNPTASWGYNDGSGILFYVARYDPAEGKQFCPWSWSATAQKWVPKSWPSPRPLYGLAQLKARPTAPVLICEGEKAAEAAKQLIGGAYVCVSWANGAKAVDKADWSPIYGRKVLIWPDADGPGKAAADTLVKILSGKCPEIKILDVSGQPDKWDAADGLADGWDFDKTVAWAKPRAQVITATAVSQAPGATAAAQVNVTINMGDDSPSSASAFAIWEGLGLATNNSGGVYYNQDNVLRVLDRHPPLKDLLWFDEFHQKYFTMWNSTAPREWEDVDETRLTTYLQRTLGLAKMSDDTIHKASVEYAKRHVKNDPKDWMESLKWDEKDRVAFFLAEAFGAAESSEYVWAASRNFWIGMIARVFRPGCKLDNMLVLEGPQGKFKSTALDIIGGGWFAEARGSVLDKDFFLNLRGKLIMEIAELDAFSRAEVTAIKQVITCRVDRFRAPYERSSKDHPRSSIFVGTTNEQFYLRDNTGGRRFWPIVCKDIKLAWITENREQLFAEAVHLFKSGATWWEMPKGETEIEQEKRRSQDEWENIMADYLQFKDETTIREIAVDCLKVEVARLDRFVQLRIGGLLRNLGWDKSHRALDDGKQGKVWFKKGAAQQQLL